VLTAWAVVGVLIGAAAIWLNISKPDRKQAPAAKAATDAASAVRETLAERPDAE
jgi:hypothetical protein